SPPVHVGCERRPSGALRERIGPLRSCPAAGPHWRRCWNRWDPSGPWPSSRPCPVPAPRSPFAPTWAAWCGRHSCGHRLAVLSGDRLGLAGRVGPVAGDDGEAPLDAVDLADDDVGGHGVSFLSGGLAGEQNRRSVWRCEWAVWLIAHP